MINRIVQVERRHKLCSTQKKQTKKFSNITNKLTYYNNKRIITKTLFLSRIADKAMWSLTKCKDDFKSHSLANESMEIKKKASTCK